MFWVHNKFENEFDDPDGPSWLTRLPNQIGLTQTGRAGRKTHTGWVDLMNQTSLTTHTYRSCLSSSSTWHDTTRPNSARLGHWPRLGPTRSSNQLNPSGLSRSFVSLGTPDKFVSMGWPDLARSSDRLGLTRSSGRLGLSG